MKLFTLLFIVFVDAMRLLSQENEMSMLEHKVFDLESSILNYSSQQDKMKLEIDEYAREISELKQKKSLNYFQRGRLENYLKSSQELAERLEINNQQIRSIIQELNISRKQLIDLYNARIDDLVRQLQDNSLAESRTKELIQQLTSTKQKRETLQAKLELEIQFPLSIDQIVLDADDSPRQMKEKADLLSDMAMKLRSNAEKLSHIISNLNEEIEIRDRMMEFEQELSLFSHQDEPTSTGTANEKNTYDRGEGFSNPANAFLLDARHSKSSIFALFPGLSFDNDKLSSLNELDIQTIINGLLQRQKQMLQAADSLKIKADSFYQKAEQAKEIKRQD